MLNDRTIAIAQRYWSQHLGCEPGELFAHPARAIRHGGELAGYEGVFALFRMGRVIISAPVGDKGGFVLPPHVKQAFLKWFWCQEFTPECFVRTMQPLVTHVIGPAFLGYAERIAPPDPTHAVRPVGTADSPAREVLKSACDPTEWEHGGSSIANVSSGIFVDDALAALASYEVWGGAIAHISIVTHPRHRGKGYGRSAVAHVTRRAFDAGLLPQYRTLEANGPSMRIAESLGFEKYAESVALRFAA